MEIYNKIKLSAVIITYYPDLSDVIINIKQYIEYVDILIIWENTPKKDRELYKILMPEYSNKIIYLGTDKNEGMASALNKSVKWSIENEFTHILTMDQDSFWLNFKKYSQLIFENRFDSSIGIFGPNVFTEEKKQLPKIEIVKDIITSGAIYNLDLFRKIGFFREDFFIDAVDLEYCYWAKKNGFQTAILGECYLKQKYGSETIHYFLKKVVPTSNYSAFRLFHIIKNHIFLWREYPELSNFQKTRILTEYSFLRIAKILLYENGKAKKIFSLLKGALHGLFQIGEQPRKKM